MPNTFCTVSYRAKSSDGSWQTNSVPKRGHPLYVEFTLMYKEVKTSPSISAVYAKGSYGIQNDYGSLVDYKKPIWSSSGVFTDGIFSKCPALFQSGKKNILTVDLYFDDAMYSVPFRLEGYLNSELIFRSASMLGARGSNSVAVDFLPDTQGAVQKYGDVSWVLVVLTNDQKIKVPGATRLELYWIQSAPGPMFTKGVWVKLYRSLFVALVQNSSTENLVRQLVNYCFSPTQEGFRKLYDSRRGAAHYGPRNWGGFFDINKYFGGSTDWANCYDQAGVLQTALGAFGVYNSWAFQNPFGFINKTDLLGRGLCNNPFYLINNSDKLIGINDPKRTLFGNHVYLVIRGNVLDACQGPYRGDDSIQSYISQSIDTVTTLYANQNPPSNFPGTANDVFSAQGITSVESAAMSDTHPTSIHSAALKQVLGTLDASTAQADALCFSAPKEGLFLTAFAQSGYQLSYRRIVIGRDGVLVLDSLLHAASGLSVSGKVWISSRGDADAREQLLHEVDSVQWPLTAADMHPVAQLGDYAIALGADMEHVLWAQHNVFVSLVAMGKNNVLPLAQAIHANIEGALLTPSQLKRLAVSTLEPAGQSVAVGQSMTIKFKQALPWFEFDYSGNGRLEALSVTPESVEFKGIEAGSVEVTFMVGHPDSLTVTRSSVHIVVTP